MYGPTAVQVDLVPVLVPVPYYRSTKVSTEYRTSV
eukprot:COSAG01_NODE_25837_length_731_cov_2.329114_1_plen_34_part_10